MLQEKSNKFFLAAYHDGHVESSEADRAISDGIDICTSVNNQLYDAWILGDDCCAQNPFSSIIPSLKRSTKVDHGPGEFFMTIVR